MLTPTPAPVTSSTPASTANPRSMSAHPVYGSTSTRVSATGPLRLTDRTATLVGCQVCPSIPKQIKQKNFFSPLAEFSFGFYLFEHPQNGSSNSFGWTKWHGKLVLTFFSIVSVFTLYCIMFSYFIFTNPHFNTINQGNLCTGGCWLHNVSITGLIDCVEKYFFFVWVVPIRP